MRSLIDRRSELVKLLRSQLGSLARITPCLICETSVGPVHVDFAIFDPDTGQLLAALKVRNGSNTATSQRVEKYSSLGVPWRFCTEPADVPRVAAWIRSILLGTPIAA